MAISWNNRAKRQGLAKDVVDLVVAFEKEFNIKIDDKDIKQFQTVEDIVKYLKK